MFVWNAWKLRNHDLVLSNCFQRRITLDHATPKFSTSNFPTIVLAFANQRNSTQKFYIGSGPHFIGAHEGRKFQNRQHMYNGERQWIQVTNHQLTTIHFVIVQHCCVFEGLEISGRCSKSKDAQL